MAELISGQMITRVEWGSSDEYGVMKNERLIIHTRGEDHIWEVSAGDLLAEDWAVVPQAN